MMQLATKLLTVEEFIREYGDENYELIDGEIITVEATGPHEQVCAWIGRKLNVEIDLQDINYFIPHRCLIKLLGTQTAFRPDIIVLDKNQIINEPLWHKEPVITLGKSIKLVVEVVSTNWQNDYARKVEDYALLGISEYWIIDYLGLGGREYIGKSKQPTITICQLEEDEYKKRLFQHQDQLISAIFPQLKITANQVFQSAM